jgi:transcriptional regulator of arginine metabolism
VKSTRQRAILALIARRPVHSQDELAQLLAKQGHETTQATISRDIRELGLIKVPLRDGNETHFKYVEPSAGPSYLSRLHRIVAELVLSIAGSGNLVVLRTPPGSGMLVASAVDEAGWPEIIGTIGGDDTVLAILADARHLAVVKQRFADMRGVQNAS